ncbi:MAG: glycosyltransferase family 2 protein [Pseudomonadota bacterium]
MNAPRDGLERRASDVLDLSAYAAPPRPKRRFFSRPGLGAHADPVVTRRVRERVDSAAEPGLRRLVADAPPLRGTPGAGLGLGIGVADLLADPPDPDLFAPGEIGALADPALLLEMRLLPWQRIAGEVVWISDALGNPDALAESARAHGLLPGEAIFARVDTEGFEDAFSACYGERLARRAERWVPARESVRSLGSIRGRLALLAALAGLAALLSGEAGAVAIFLLVFVVNTLTGCLRLAAFLAALSPRSPDPRAHRLVLDNSDEPEWPMISILVPLYREADMVPRLMASLDRIDYPRDALEVLLVVEGPDRATREALEAMRLPDWARVVPVPEGAPRTKPRALNYALNFCRGEVIGILDAEDRPEPGQLLAVAGALRVMPERVACVQCQLSYFNARENWITRCFSLEYAIWFDVLLRGFERLGLPVPLGGTSVYFRREALEDVGGWDAHNVTEDADLGMRLFRRGYRVRVLTARTDEEANCRPLPWIRQRSRWLKGYLLTWLCHIRQPVTLWEEMGPRGFLGFNVLFLGAACSYLAMPLFWISVIGWLLTGTTPWDRYLPDWAFWPLAASLAGGQGLMLSAAALAMWRKGALDLLLWVPSLPLYWTLGALAAWKAVIELFLAPYYWDKTRHGVSRMLAPRPSRRRPPRLRSAGNAPCPEARFGAWNGR